MMTLVKKLCILNKFDDKAQHQGQVIYHPRAQGCSTLFVVVHIAQGFEAS